MKQRPPEGREWVLRVPGVQHAPCMGRDRMCKGPEAGVGDRGRTERGTFSTHVQMKAALKSAWERNATDNGRTWRVDPADGFQGQELG